MYKPLHYLWIAPFVEATSLPLVKPLRSHRSSFFGSKPLVAPKDWCHTCSHLFCWASHLAGDLNTYLWAYMIHLLEYCKHHHQPFQIHEQGWQHTNMIISRKIYMASSSSNLTFLFRYLNTSSHLLPRQLFHQATCIMNSSTIAF